jgi:type I restriction enzyme S subunit
MSRVEIENLDCSRHLVEGGDLLFARRSLTFEGAGKCSIVLRPDEATTWESSIIRARLNDDVADSGYYFYYFMSPQGRRVIELIVEQVAAAGIRLSDLAKLRVPVPTLSEQQAIAEILGALDDKISANYQISVASDSLMRSIYEKQLRTAESITSIASIADEMRNLVDPTSLPRGTSYIGLEHMPRRLMWLNKSATSADVTSIKSSFRKSDILFGKLRPYFHKVVIAPTVGVCSTDIIVCRAKDSRIADFVLAVIASDQVVDRCSAASEGTRMPRTNWRDLSAIDVPWPGVEAAVALSGKFLQIRAAAEIAICENATLTELRDTLLPQLMSGRLRVKDAEKQVGAAV